ncbi:MAG: hypothetical protein ILO42_03710, partial [Clostridia bacterium]|nr:hypothetical protein [Clostridia bacterium]
MKKTVFKCMICLTVAVLAMTVILLTGCEDLIPGNNPGQGTAAKADNTSGPAKTADNPSESTTAEVTTAEMTTAEESESTAEEI